MTSIDISNNPAARGLFCSMMRRLGDAVDPPRGQDRTDEMVVMHSAVAMNALATALAYEMMFFLGIAPPEDEMVAARIVSDLAKHMIRASEEWAESREALLN